MVLTTYTVSVKVNVARTLAHTQSLGKGYKSKENIFQDIRDRDQITHPQKFLDPMDTLKGMSEPTSQNFFFFENRLFQHHSLP